MSELALPAVARLIAQLRWADIVESAHLVIAIDDLTARRKRLDALAASNDPADRQIAQLVTRWAAAR